MENKGLKAKVLSGLFWKLMERGGTQGVQVIIHIVLARLLMPEDYGLIAIITVFISFANILIIDGFNSALIQKKYVDDRDYSSVFYLSLLIAVLLYIIIYLTAPYIANFYQQDRLVMLIRVLSIILFLGAFNSIQIALISKNMQFKKLFISSLLGIILSGIIGIVLAYKGFGVWALVLQQLINKIVLVTILWIVIKWRPVLVFSIDRVKVLFFFGWKIMASSLLFNLYNDLRSLLVGKIYNPEMLGYYNRGSQFPELIVNNVNLTIQSVMFPVFSSQQNNKIMLRKMVQRSIVTSSFVVIPLMVGLATVAEPMVKLLLTEKWLPSVPFIRIFCFTFALWPIHTANQQVVNALGRSDITLKLNIIKRILELIILGATVNFGIYAIALGGILSGLIGTVINAYPNKELLNYSYKEQWKDVAPILALSLIMGLVVYSIHLIVLPAWIILSIQITAGILIYFGLARILKLECYEYLVTTLKGLLTES